MITASGSVPGSSAMIERVGLCRVRARVDEVGGLAGRRRGHQRLGDFARDPGRGDREEAWLDEGGAVDGAGRGPRVDGHEGGGPGLLGCDDLVATQAVAGANDDDRVRRAGRRSG